MNCNRAGTLRVRAGGEAIVLERMLHSAGLLALMATVGVVAAQPADATTAPSLRAGGASVYSATQAGYVASGRDFRFAQAVITVPAAACTDASPAVYVALRSPGNSAGAGLACLSGTWSAFAARSITRLYGPQTDWASLPGVPPGDGVLVSVYFDHTRHTLRFAIVPPLVPASYFSMSAPSRRYPQAEALADWSLPIPSSPVPAAGVTGFLRGRFTTAGGTHGTFKGPWRLNVYKIAAGSGGAPRPGRTPPLPPPLWADSGSYYGLAGWRVPLPLP
jgi:hypothetical protein